MRECWHIQLCNADTSQDGALSAGNPSLRRALAARPLRNSDGSWAGRVEIVPIEPIESPMLDAESAAEVRLLLKRGVLGAGPNRTDARQRAGLSVIFCTRQFVISPTSSSFSFRQSIEFASPNCLGSLPADPKCPTR